MLDKPVEGIIHRRDGQHHLDLFVQDYQTPKSKELSRDLTSQLNLCIQFLVECRPLSVSMGTAIKNLKLQVADSLDCYQDCSTLRPLNQF